MADCGVVEKKTDKNAALGVGDTYLPFQALLTHISRQFELHITSIIKADDVFVGRGVKTVDPMIRPRIFQKLFILIEINIRKKYKRTSILIPRNVYIK